MLNLGRNQPAATNGALNLSRTGAPTAGSYPMGAGPAPNAMMDGLYAGAGVDPRYFQQPVAPPSFSCTYRPIYQKSRNGYTH